MGIDSTPVQGKDLVGSVEALQLCGTPSFTTLHERHGWWDIGTKLTSGTSWWDIGTKLTSGTSWWDIGIKISSGTGWWAGLRGTKRFVFFLLFTRSSLEEAESSILCIEK